MERAEAEYERQLEVLEKATGLVERAERGDISLDQTGDKISIQARVSNWLGWLYKGQCGWDFL